MLAKEGYPTIFIVFLASLAAILTANYLSGGVRIAVICIAVFLFVFTLLFFRDPQRVTPEGEELVIAPADGRVVLVRDVANSYLTGGKGKQISIFLSLANVHVNRVPVSGLLERVNYRPGKYLTAWKEEASELNEQAHFGVCHPSGKRFLFKQITGLLARRIEYNIHEGDELIAGQRFGIMKFGSRMDILIPDGVEIQVKKGDRTVGGETIIGVINA